MAAPNKSYQTYLLSDSPRGWENKKWCKTQINRLKRREGRMQTEKEDKDLKLDDLPNTFQDWRDEESFEDIVEDYHPDDEDEDHTERLPDKLFWS